MFTSWGVGQTYDDLPMAGIARGFGTEVVRQPEFEQRVRAYWGERLAKPNLRLADVPAGAELVYGRDQVWPVVAYRNVYICRACRGCSGASSSTSAIGSAPSR